MIAMIVRALNTIVVALLAGVVSKPIDLKTLLSVF